MTADPPTTSAGDSGSAVPRFRGGVERVDESTPASPAPPPREPSSDTDSVPTAPTVPPREPDVPSETAPRPDPGPRFDPGPRPDTVSYPPSTPRPTGGSAPGPDPVTTVNPATGVTTAVATEARTDDRRAAASNPPAPTEPVHQEAPRRSGKVRARKVRRIVRHIEPWSVLKISLLFYAALFLIVCVASAILWSGARASGTVDNVESFITSVGGFGNCEPIDGAAPVTTTTLPGAISTGPVNQIDPGGVSPSVADPAVAGAVSPGDEADCREGERLIGEFKFADARIFEAFALGGIVLVLAGAGANVVMVLLFNLMSDLTGGVRVTVLEEDTPARPRSASGSPGPRPRD